MYKKHLSEELNKLFKANPYECQDPRKARILFLGLDASFGADIETDAFYPYIKEYLSDGVSFWENHSVHHPFLLPFYRISDGVRYHKQFAKVGLNANHYDTFLCIDIG